MGENSFPAAPNQKKVHPVGRQIPVVGHPQVARRIYVVVSGEISSCTNSLPLRIQEEREVLSQQASISVPKERFSQKEGPMLMIGPRILRLTGITNIFGPAADHKMPTPTSDCA
ncbi:hypothetical protein VTO42DRAFT_8866 [Malbranchea cinnamomea]